MPNDFITTHEFEKESNRIFEANMLALQSRRNGLGKILSKTYTIDDVFVKDSQFDKKIESPQKQDYFQVMP